MKRTVAIVGTFIFAMLALAAPAGAASKTFPLTVKTSGPTLTITVAGAAHSCHASYSRSESDGGAKESYHCANGGYFTLASNGAMHAHVAGGRYVYACVHSFITELPSVLTCNAKRVR